MYINFDSPNTVGLPEHGQINNASKKTTPSMRGAYQPAVVVEIGGTEKTYQSPGGRPEVNDHGVMDLHPNAGFPAWKLNYISSFFMNLAMGLEGIEGTLACIDGLHLVCEEGFVVETGFQIAINNFLEQFSKEAEILAGIARKLAERHGFANARLPGVINFSSRPISAGQFFLTEEEFRKATNSLLEALGYQLKGLEKAFELVEERLGISASGATVSLDRLRGMVTDFRQEVTSRQRDLNREEQNT